jgi:hypothetical protein
VAKHKVVYANNVNYSALNRKEILTYAGTWMNLEAFKPVGEK